METVVLPLPGHPVMRALRKLSSSIMRSISRPSGVARISSKDGRWNSNGISLSPFVSRQWVCQSRTASAQHLCQRLSSPFSHRIFLLCRKYQYATIRVGLQSVVFMETAG